MKQLTAIFAFLFVITFANAQSSFQEEPRHSSDYQILKGSDGKSLADFTVTDSDGLEWNLFDKLDSGYTVIIDLFQST